MVQDGCYGYYGTTISKMVSWNKNISTGIKITSRVITIGIVTISNARSPSISHIRSPSMSHISGAPVFHGLNLDMAKDEQKTIL